LIEQNNRCVVTNASLNSLERRLSGRQDEPMRKMTHGATALDIVAAANFAPFNPRMSAARSDQRGDAPAASINRTDVRMSREAFAEIENCTPCQFRRNWNFGYCGACRSHCFRRHRAMAVAAACASTCP